MSTDLHEIVDELRGWASGRGGWSAYEFEMGNRVASALSSLLDKIEGAGIEKVLNKPDHAPLGTHDPRDGSCLQCPWPLHELDPETIAAAVRAYLLNEVPDA